MQDSIVPLRIHRDPRSNWTPRASVSFPLEEIFILLAPPMKELELCSESLLYCCIPPNEPRFAHNLTALNLLEFEVNLCYRGMSIEIPRRLVVG